MQFDSYSYEKIHSHAGVRSDLFHRPLEETRITDFFGAVAQVEVIPPEIFSSPEESAEFKEALVQHEVSDDVTFSPSPDVNVKINNTAYYSEVNDNDAEKEDGANWRIVRVWSAFGLIGGLIGLVSFRSRPRR